MHCEEASQEPRASAHHLQVQMLEGLPKSPPWTKGVKKGIGKPRKDQNKTVKSRNGESNEGASQRQCQNLAISSTSADNNIPVVKTKVVSVFATQFASNLDIDTLRSYLADKLGKPVICR